MTNRATKYANRIRNATKRAYALAFIDYLNGTGPEPKKIGLSEMAAQAVRMNVRLEWSMPEAPASNVPMLSALLPPVG